MGIKVTKKTLNFLSEKFGHIKKNIYFCTRKSVAQTTENEATV